MKQAFRVLAAHGALISACVPVLAGCAGNVLTFGGRQHAFSVAGAGGRHRPLHRRAVYNLTSISQFAGTYGQARYGFAIGTSSAGDLWLQNEAGVILHLKAKREGLMLSLGGDAVVITLNQ